MDEVLIERADAVVTVTLNQPHKKNAISPPMWDELAATFRGRGPGRERARRGRHRRRG